jgi:hypothetical protein
MSGTWTTLTHQPPGSVDTMLLLTDGTVLAHQNSGSNWYRLTPDSTGHYENGTWTTVAPMPNNPAIPAAVNGPAYGPQFFGSAVLKDGTMMVIGGEYNFGASADLAAATLYDPVANSWTNLATPAGWTNVGDVPLCVMPDGRVLLGSIDDNRTAFFNPSTKSYTAGPNKNDRCAEESFTLLPDGTVLAVQCSAIPGAEKYVPSSNSWVSAGHTPSTLPQACPGIVPEIGPTVLLPNGHALVVGATGNTALYSPPAAPASPGTWSAGPVLKDSQGNTLYPIDAPCVLLPNGKVLIAASPSPPCSFPGPTFFLEYDPLTNTVGLVASPTNAGSACFTGRFLLLPSGKVLFSNQGPTVSIYTPSGSYAAAWQPHITSFPSTVNPGHTYTLSGQQLNGLSQACTYGDDATMATNYPIARATNTASNVITYLRTANHSTMAVATGTAIVSTSVTIPASIATGTYSLVVVANGIPSAAVTVSVVKIKPLKEKVEIKEVKEFKQEIKEIKDKEIKEVKIEIKEFKEIKEGKIEIKEIEKPIVETKLKDSEGGDLGQLGGDPALQSATEAGGAATDNTAAGNQRAPIAPEERPVVGEAPLQHSVKPLR